MAVGRTWNVDFLHENSQRKYPLMDNVTAQRSDEAFTIPDDFILDMCLPVTSDSDGYPAGYFISQVASYSSGYVLTISHTTSSGVVDIGVVTVASATHTWGTTYVIFDVQTDSTLIDPSQAETGSMVIGDLDNINLQPAGVWEFTEAETRIQPRCIIPVVPGLQGFRVRSSGVLSELLRDVVVFEPGSNVRFRLDTDTNTIYLDAAGDEDFTAACVCEGSRSAGTAIRTINGIAPNANGDFTLQPGRDCLAITEVTNGILISDGCSAPCCGCTELDIINAALQTVRDQFATLNAFAERLETTADGLNLVVTASPLYPG